MKNNYRIISLIIVLIFGVVFIASQYARDTYLASRTATPAPTAIAQASAAPTELKVLGVKTKFADCKIVSGMPDVECSPGAIFPNITKEQVCTPGYATSVRNVSQSTKNKVYEEYGFPATGHQPGEFEVDHIISLELGGSNDIANLFPEPAEPRPGYHEKDKVENYLHDQVCSGAISLQEAQQKIAGNWLEVYQQINH